MAVAYRCSQCGSVDLVAVTPYWSRCNACQATTYTPRLTATSPNASRVRLGGTRRLYGPDALPLPVRTDPRKRFVEGILGTTAAGLFALSVPLGIVLLAAARGHGIDEVFLTPGVSLVVTLWIFSGIGLTGVAVYSAVQVLRKKSEAGGGWIAFGIMALIMCAAFLGLGGLAGAWAGIVGSALILGSGILDIMKPKPAGWRFLH